MPQIGMPELAVILVLMLLVFGPKKLPELARGLAHSIREFKQAMRDTFSGDEATGPGLTSADHRPEARTELVTAPQEPDPQELKTR